MVMAVTTKPFELNLTFLLHRQDQELRGFLPSVNVAFRRPRSQAMDHCMMQPGVGVLENSNESGKDCS